MARLPFTAIDTEAAPPVVDRATWQQQVDQLLVREKAHTHEGDAIAAARRRLPMTPVPADATIVGSDGEVPFLEAFEGRSQLIVYFHMWHDGNPWDQQCEGCTFFTAQVQQPAYLHSRDITLAVFTEGTYEESKPYADFVQNDLPWYSARGADALLAGRDFGMIVCYLRVGDQAYETYWSTGRGTESMAWSYHLMDLSVFGRQETWEDSPEGWTRGIGVRGEQFRTDGRPTIQWTVTDDPVSTGARDHCH
jgi:predicted dithiol-disulfide oxidoreductase (DUF899 family)